jgi:hypothetical protein
VVFSGARWHAMFRFREYNRAYPPTITDLLTSPTMNRARGSGVSWLSLCFSPSPLFSMALDLRSQDAIAGDNTGKSRDMETVKGNVARLSRRVVQASQPLTLGPWGSKWVWQRCRTTNVEETMWKWVAEPPLIRLGSHIAALTRAGRSVSEHRFVTTSRRSNCVWHCPQLHGRSLLLQ